MQDATVVLLYHSVMKTHCFLLLLLAVLLSLSICPSYGRTCDRTMGLSVPKTSGSGRFDISISGDPDKYVPGAIYTVKVLGREGSDKYGTDKFTGFLLVAEPVSGNLGQTSAGTFRLKDDSLARYSEFCPLAVKHASEVAKAEVQVLWIAPQASTGCVNFRATVIKTPQVWYMDEGNLTHTICPEDDGIIVDEEDNQDPCMACDEAKYELTFEALWTSLTHPRGFPDNFWAANFSDIIGASHSPDFRVWDYHRIATDGLQLVAETGDPSILESELKNQSEKIRTIIKARGIRHAQQSKGFKTFAVFRADRTHNVVSFVSKIDPSPDWFVGVSGLNLCTKNGSWVTEKTMNLFPIDAGTDSGTTYLSPDMPTIPKTEIRRLVWSSNVNSPFYDPDGNMLKPFAKIKFQQQRSYRRSGCDLDHAGGTGQGGLDRQYGGGYGGSTNMVDYDGDDEFADDSMDRDRPECRVTPWGRWSPCHPSCGSGVTRRSREYGNKTLAREARCDRKLLREKPCYNPKLCKGFPSSSSTSNFYGGVGNMDGGSGSNSFVEPMYTPVQPQYNPRPSYYQPPVPPIVPESRNPPPIYTPTLGAGGDDRDPMSNVCGVTEYESWSLCENPCGGGVRYQYRKYLHPDLARKHGCNIPLQNMGQCPRTNECREPTEKVDKGCEVTAWTAWSNCSQTCGKGVTTRSRMYARPSWDHSKCTLPLRQTVPCDGDEPQCPEERHKEDCLEPGASYGECSSNVKRWYFDRVKLRCVHFSYSGCKGSRNNFGSPQECEETCGSLRDGSGGSSGGYRTRHSKYSTTVNDGDRGHRTHHGRTMMGNYYSYPTYNNTRSYNDGPLIDCRLSPWSPWSKCSVKCGWGWKYQYRYVEVFNENGGKPCSQHLERSERCQGTECPNYAFGHQHQHPVIRTSVTSNNAEDEEDEEYGDYLE